MMFFENATMAPEPSVSAARAKNERVVRSTGTARQSSLRPRSVQVSPNMGSEPEEERHEGLLVFPPLLLSRTAHAVGAGEGAGGAAGASAAGAAPVAVASA